MKQCCCNDNYNDVNVNNVNTIEDIVPMTMTIVPIMLEYIVRNLEVR
jgi:hypothetical protein